MQFEPTIQLYRKYHRPDKRNNGAPKSELCSSSLVPSRRKPLKKHRVSSEVVRAVIDGVLGQKLTYQEVALKHRISGRLVGRLIKEYKSDPAALDRLIDGER